MSLRDYMPSRLCPECAGDGCYDIPDATTPGRSFVSVCSRCHGVGSVQAHLVDAVADTERPCAKRVGCIYFHGHEGACFAKEDDYGS